MTVTSQGGKNNEGVLLLKSACTIDVGIHSEAVRYQGIRRNFAIKLIKI